MAYKESALFVIRASNYHPLGLRSVDWMTILAQPGWLPPCRRTMGSKEQTQHRWVIIGINNYYIALGDNTASNYGKHRNIRQIYWQHHTCTPTNKTSLFPHLGIMMAFLYTASQPIQPYLLMWLTFCYNMMKNVHIQLSKFSSSKHYNNRFLLFLIFAI